MAMPLWKRLVQMTPEQFEAEVHRVTERLDNGQVSVAEADEFVAAVQSSLEHQKKISEQSGRLLQTEPGDGLSRR
jgi:hypothetical protein